MSKTLAQIFALNPAITVADTDLFYLVQSPYSVGTDAAILGADLKTAFGKGTVTSISAGTGITLTPNPITVTGTISLTTPVSLANGGTNASLVASNGGIFYSTATAGAILAGTATANQTLLSGSSTTPAWSTATYPPTTTINQLLYSSAANTIGGLSTVNRASLSTNSTGVPTWLALTDGQIVIGSTAGSPAAASLSAGTGVTITPGSNTITISATGTGGTVTSLTAGTGITLTPSPITTTGSVALSVPVTEILGGTNQTTYTLGDTLYSSAANTLSKLAGNITAVKQYLSQTGTGAVSAAPAWATISGSDITGAALTKTDDTNVTLTLGGTPATALLRAASLTLGWTGTLSLSRGGTAAALTASNGGIFYSTASAGAILSGTSTANQILMSGASTTPAWSTATYPATAGTSGNVLTSDGTNWISSVPSSTSLLTTKGDLFSFSTVDARLPVATGDGKILQVSSAAATGLAYSTATYPVTAGSSGNVLTSDGTNFLSSAPAAASTTVITDDTTTNASMFPTWVTANTGSLPLKVSSTKLSFNPSTAALTLTGSINGLTGTISAPTDISSSAAALLLQFNYVASAVNYWQISNAATGGSPTLIVGGSNANINATFGTKSGTFNFVDSLNAVSPILKIFNAAGTHATGFQVATAQSTDVTFTVPAADGAANTPIITNGSTVLGFTPSSAGTNIIGTTTNGNASAGSVGEFISSTIAVASAVSLVNATPKDVTSISLTAGDWDVTGNVYFTSGGAITLGLGWISSTSATLLDGSLISEFQPIATSTVLGFSVPFRRITLTGTTTIYLSADAAFSVSANVCGGLYARRAR